MIGFSSLCLFLVSYPWQLVKGICFGANRPLSRLEVRGGRREAKIEAEVKGERGRLSFDKTLQMG